MEVENLCSSQDGLGESPIWVEEERSVYWCDHVAARWHPGLDLPYGTGLVPTIKRFHLPTGQLSVWPLPEQVGSIGLRRSGGLVAGCRSGFATVALAGVGPGGFRSASGGVVEAGGGFQSALEPGGDGAGCGFAPRQPRGVDFDGDLRGGGTGSRQGVDVRADLPGGRTAWRQRVDARGHFRGGRAAWREPVDAGGDPVGERTSSRGAALHYLVDPEPGLSDNRLNDGKVDPRGRFWCGSMDTRVRHESGRLYVLEPDGRCREVAADYAFRVSNGMAFDPEGTRMYFADTFRKQIVVFDYDRDQGRLSGRREFYSTAEHPGLPDGGTVDAEGYYWIALVQGGRILRLDPRGRLARVLELPIPTPTCVAFGGDHYETLFVTSQKAFLSPEMLARYPQTGDLFAIHGLGVRGLPEPRFAG